MERVKVQGSFQASDRCDILLLTEETHADVVPELGAVRVVHGSDPILQKRSIMITLILNDRPSCEDCLWILGIVRERVTEELEGLKVLTDPNVEQAYRCQNLAILWRELQTLQVDFYGTFIVLLDLEHAAQLDVSAFMFVDHVRLGEVGDGLVVDSQELVAQTFIEEDFPVFVVEVEALVEDLDRRLVPANQVERTAELLQVVAVNRVQQVALLEELERFVDLAL